jgi:hypothetical protein
MAAPVDRDIPLNKGDDRRVTRLVVADVGGGQIAGARPLWNHVPRDGAWTNFRRGMQPLGSGGRIVERPNADRPARRSGSASGMLWRISSRRACPGQAGFMGARKKVHHGRHEAARWMGRVSAVDKMSTMKREPARSVFQVPCSLNAHRTGAREPSLDTVLCQPETLRRHPQAHERGEPTRGVRLFSPTSKCTCTNEICEALAARTTVRK